ncbi:preprotein translocase subunit TatB [Dactylosporangium salmoneum]|uniref:preprotein translocase subunit TatB n=1 Tax=Dactylosporangium salmoneum TaxID=53361 RepID=UPI0031CE73E2
MGLENLSSWHVLVLVLVGIFVLGPDRLPRAISDGLRLLRQVRRMAQDATGELSRDLGTDIALEDLHPKALLRKHLLSEDDEAALRAPIDGLLNDLRETAGALDHGTSAARPSSANSAHGERAPHPYSEAT